MTPVLLIFVSLALAVEGQLNPLGRFGKCIDINIDTVDECDFEGTWYVQYRPENPDHHVHTCQAQYEHVTTDGILHSLLYYYNKGKSVNNPQHIKYTKISPGKYKRGITVDEEGVYIKLYIIDYDKDAKSRVLYYCADSELANPDIFNVHIATRDQVPDNLEAVLKAGKAKLLEASPKFDVTLMKVEQSLDKCAPLVVSKADAESFFKG